MVSVPECDPTVVGLNVTEIVQLAPAERLPGHAVRAYWALNEIELMVSVAFPLFVSLTDLAALEDPTETPPKLRLLGLTVALGAPVPVPVREAPEPPAGSESVAV